MSKHRNKRVEQEINEILERSDLGDSEPAPNRRYRPSRKKVSVDAPRRALGRVPSGIAWLAGIFGFAILAILIADTSRTLAYVFAIASILVLFSPLLFWSRPAPVDSQQKEWRGRVIQLPPRQEGLIGKLKYKVWEIRNRSR